MKMELALQAKLLSTFYLQFPDASLNALATETREWSVSSSKVPQ
jgi:hypothetical protein